MVILSGLCVLEQAGAGYDQQCAGCHRLILWIIKITVAVRVSLNVMFSLFIHFYFQYLS